MTTTATPILPDQLATGDRLQSAGGASFMTADETAAIEAEADRNAAADWAVNQDRYSVLTTGERFAGRWAR